METNLRFPSQFFNTEQMGFVNAASVAPRMGSAPLSQHLQYRVLDVLPLSHRGRGVNPKNPVPYSAVYQPPVQKHPGVTGGRFPS